MEDIQPKYTPRSDSPPDAKPGDPEYLAELSDWPILGDGITGIDIGRKGARDESTEGGAVEEQKGREERKQEIKEEAKKKPVFPALDWSDCHFQADREGGEQRPQSDSTPRRQQSAFG